MFKNYLKIAIRTIQKQKVYSIINIFGLTVGIAVFVLIGLYVKKELSFDRYHQNSDKIYRLVRGESDENETGFCTTSPPLASALLKEIPDIVNTARFLNSENMLISVGEEHFAETRVFWADNSLLDIFTFSFIKGDAGTALTDPSNIVLSEDIAAKYFGDENPIGKTITIQERFAFTVSGVIQNTPSNSHFSMDLILPIQRYFQITNNDESKWTSNYLYTYALLHENAKPETVEQKIGEFENKYFASYFDNKVPRFFFLQPISEIHLHSHRRQEIEANNDFKWVLIFLTSGILILLIACINYINLATAKSSARFKEVGMRKVLGAKHSHILSQFLGESFVMVFIATIFSVVLVLIAMPMFNELMKSKLSFNLFNQPQLVGYLLLIFLLVGLLAGVFPSRMIARIKPIGNLNNVGLSGIRKGKINMRNVLVVFQFSISIVLIILTLVVGNRPPGLKPCEFLS